MKRKLCNAIDENSSEHSSESSEDFDEEAFHLERHEANKLKLVTHPEKYPFNGIGCVEVFGSDRYHEMYWHSRGTGTLISPKHVLTCTHISLNKYKSVGKRYEFAFYTGDKMERFKVKKVHNFQHYFVQGIANRYDYDIALIEL